MTATRRLAELGLTLPEVPEPAAAYQPWARHGDLVFTAGQLPIIDGSLARTAALNLLATAAAGAGGIDRVRVVKVTVFVACTPTFTDQHLVANGASTLIGDVLGDAGVHSRSAVGVCALPLDSPVEVEAIVAVLSD